MIAMMITVPLLSVSILDKFADDLRYGSRIAVTEVRRSIRWYFRQPRRKLSLAVLVLVFGSILLFGGVPIAYSAGQTVRIEQRLPFLPAIRQQMTLVIGGLIYLFLSRTIEQLSHIDSEDLMLTTTTPRAVVIGLLTAEMVRFLMWFGLPLLLITGAFAAGTQTIVLLLTIPLILAPIFAFTAVYGYLSGIAVLFISRYLPIPSNIKTIVYALVIIVSIVGSQVVAWLIVSDGLPFSLAPIGHALLVSPFAAYADFFLIGMPVDNPISPSAVLVLIGLIVSVPIGFTVASRLATRFWMTDITRGSETTDTTHDSETTDTTHDSETTDAEDSETSMTPTRVPRPFRWWQSARVGWHYLRRGARSPKQFAHLMFIVIALATSIASTFSQSGFTYVFVLGASIIVGAILAGSAFGLNPFGDEQSIMPLLLLTTTPPQQFLRGRIIAGLVVGVPLIVVVPSMIAVVGPQSVLEVFAYVLVGIGLAVTSAAWAVGLGTAYPKYESREMWGVDSVSPSILILSGHSFGVVIVGLISLALTGVGLRSLADGSSIQSLYLGGAAVWIVIVAASAAGAYLYAVRRYRSHTLDY